MGNEQRPRRRGRPPLPMPEPTPDTMENVARALLTTPPKREDEWEYIQEHKTKYDSGRKPTRAERRRAEREARKGKVTDFVSGTCPNGHPEQAQAWMLYGEPPSQCPRCGETPRFDAMPE